MSDYKYENIITNPYFYNLKISIEIQIKKDFEELKDFYDNIQDFYDKKNNKKFNDKKKLLFDNINFILTKIIEEENININSIDEKKINLIISFKDNLNNYLIFLNSDKFSDISNFNFKINKTLKPKSNNTSIFSSIFRNNTNKIFLMGGKKSIK